jgi:hypothetical protein
MCAFPGARSTCGLPVFQKGGLPAENYPRSISLLVEPLEGLTVLTMVDLAEFVVAGLAFVVKDSDGIYRILGSKRFS